MRRIGDFSQADFAVLRLAEQMQALAVNYLNEAYFAEEDLNIDNLTWDRFVKAWDEAKDGGDIGMYEFNRQLAAIIQGVIPQVLNPPQEGTKKGRGR